MAAIQLMRRVEVAGAAHDCAEVARLGTRLRDVDGAFYNGAFLTHPNVTVCPGLPEPMMFDVAEGPPLKRTTHFNTGPTWAGIGVGALLDVAVLVYALSVPAD